MERVVRVITLLQLLPRHPRSITAARLQEQLAERGIARSERSIQCVLLEMSETFLLPSRGRRAQFFSKLRALGERLNEVWA